uniref:Uncharacterized protein n=1 Tax=Nelumbo nucifera TaxID=4432 RepID=A0A822ZB47_NELNU|nr:TPA_asm: hypothetical protein HUJ06_013070 [Nelumbo nucifera]
MNVTHLERRVVMVQLIIQLYQQDQIQISLLMPGGTTPSQEPQHQMHKVEHGLHHVLLKFSH